MQKDWDLFLIFFFLASLHNKKYSSFEKYAYLTKDKKKTIFSPKLLQFQID